MNSFEFIRNFRLRQTEKLFHNSTQYRDIGEIKNSFRNRSRENKFVKNVSFECHGIGTARLICVGGKIVFFMRQLWYIEHFRKSNLSTQWLLLEVCRSLMGMQYALINEIDFSLWSTFGNRQMNYFIHPFVVQFFLSKMENKFFFFQPEYRDIHFRSRL